MPKKIRRGISKAEWLEVGLHALSDGSIADITVEGLARSLGVAKAGFYWHFKDREDLLRQLLEHWIHESTEVVSENVEVLALEPKRRLLRTVEMIREGELTRYEIPIRQWALSDATAARAVRRVTRMRLDFVRDAFHELGFRGDELEMRATLFAVYHTWEAATLRHVPRKRLRDLVARRIELLTSK